MGRCFVDPKALLQVAGMLAAMANGDEIAVGQKPTRKTKVCGCGCGHPLTPPRDEFGCFVSRRATRPVCPPPAPAPRWGVCECEPREDRNKVFGINVGRIDEPTPDMFCTRAGYIRAREKFDNLVDAVEAIDWKNKSDTAPLHKVNAVRRRIFDGPPMNLNLIGESQHWF